MTNTPSLRQGESVRPKSLHRRWGTIAFMALIHAMALLALLPRFWSWQSLTGLLILYWLTACIGITLGYHRLLSHRAFSVPRWLEMVITTCGTLAVSTVQSIGLGSIAIIICIPMIQRIITTAISDFGGVISAGC